MIGALRIAAIALGLLTLLAPGASAAGPARDDEVPLADFRALYGADEARALDALKRIDRNWHDAYAGMLMEGFWFARNRVAQPRIEQMLARASGRPFDKDHNQWYEWLWSIEPGEHSEYAEFKAVLYEQIDPRFREYFDKRPKASIRLDEIRWGGVQRDGIPPLKNQIGRAHV